MTVKGVLWHSTGANNPTLKRYVQPSDDAADRAEMLKLLGTNNNKNDWNHISHQAGLNCWIGKLADGTVTTVQTMPWDFKPWGCGSGAKGSCNNGWIQFEICEDGLTDKAYFDKVYKEACEITAYLCDMYNIDPMGTVTVNGVKVPTILCHADSHKLGLGSNHGDVNHWFPKHGKSMETARKDVAELLGKITSVIEPEEKPVTKHTKPSPPSDNLYLVRLNWDDAKSQIGAYSNLDNAKAACDKVKGYSVFDSNGKVVYALEGEVDTTAFKVGDEVSLALGATYTSGKTIPVWVFDRKLYVRELRDNGEIAVISTVKSGAITGVVKTKDLVKYGASQVVQDDFVPYLALITADVLNIRAGAGTNYRVVAQIKDSQVYTIVAQKGNWGKLKSGAGWICLDYTKKLKEVKL
jgi:hypothetical protein